MKRRQSGHILFTRAVRVFRSGPAAVYCLRSARNFVDTARMRGERVVIAESPRSR